LSVFVLLWSDWLLARLMAQQLTNPALLHQIVGIVSYYLLVLHGLSDPD